MTYLRFPLSSDQLELLLAFEETNGLNRLAEKAGRDPSVVSRALQKIAEQHSVLVKVKGRWELTPLGRKANELTRNFLHSQQGLLPERIGLSSGLHFDGSSVLVIINAQMGLLDATLLRRSNAAAEENIAVLLRHWRIMQRPVIHVRHVSENPSSTYFRNSRGCDFLPEAQPIANELIVEKLKSNAFSGTDLQEKLDLIQPSRIVLTGFTANECIDSTARASTEYGYETFVVADATASFEMSAENRLIKAERIHKLTLANLEHFYAKILKTQDLL